MKNYIWILIVLCLSACKKDVDKTDQETDVNEGFQKEIEVHENSIQLSPDSKKIAARWVEYITAENEISRIKKSTVGNVVNNSEAIAQIISSLKNSVPDSLRAVPVVSRLNVLNTKAQLLKQYSNKQKPNAELIGKTATSLIDEFDNLKIQMNELFLKSLEEFEKELDEFEENERVLMERDSIGDTITQ
ncbi:hypothetical protein [Gramella sp. AN32]|uniref:Cell surface protein n=1 Tax=Christiangramia antarctica TaxID=2058158 RepID=A0ABW5X0W2_9FLAO|nr:hypothetical protein [Gramella sp. AN32]MCM4155192.1 hypothetical protein [Gramella sp. AN32]